MCENLHIQVPTGADPFGTDPFAPAAKPKKAPPRPPPMKSPKLPSGSPKPVDDPFAGNDPFGGSKAADDGGFADFGSQDKVRTGYTIQESELGVVLHSNVSARSTKVFA